MLQEYGDIILDIKAQNARFASIFEKHSQMKKKIIDAEEGREHLESVELEGLKKEKLKLKDEAYAIIMAYKQEKGL